MRTDDKHAALTAAAANAPTAATINPKLIVPFVNSVRSVFTMMVGVPTTVERPRLKQGAEATFDVTGIIGFSGDVIGSVAVTFQKAAAIRLVAAFAGVEIDPGTDGDADFCDAVGELANMIAGAAKKDLGAAAQITCPNVIIGSGHRIARLSGIPCVVIPCRTPVGDFAVEVSVRNVVPVAVAMAKP